MRKNKTFFAKPIWEIYVYVKAHGIWLWVFFVIIFLSVRHKRHDIEKFTKEGLTNYKRKSKKRLQKKKFTKEEILQKKKKRKSRRALKLVWKGLQGRFPVCFPFRYIQKGFLLPMRIWCWIPALQMQLPWKAILYIRLMWRLRTERCARTWNAACAWTMRWQRPEKRDIIKVEKCHCFFKIWCL